jgi:hypothetical protein
MNGFTRFTLRTDHHDQALAHNAVSVSGKQKGNNYKLFYKKHKPIIRFAPWIKKYRLLEEVDHIKKIIKKQHKFFDEEV